MNQHNQRPPQLEIGDVMNIFELTDEELKQVPSEKGKWRCCAQGCERYSTVKNYGVFPVVRFGRRWIDVTNRVLYCSDHWRQYKNSSYPIPFPYKKPDQLVSEIMELFTIKADNVQHNIVMIPVEPEDLPRFKRWLRHYGMTIQPDKRDEPYINVIYRDPLDLYWLGGNFLGGIEQPVTSKDEPPKID